MSFTITSPIGERHASQLGPWMTDDLARLVDAIGSMFDPPYELVEEEGTDGEPGFVCAWGKLLDPDLCPEAGLPYLGQFVGVEVPKIMPPEEARALIKEEPMSRRGTKAVIEAAIRRSLTGEKRFTLVERRNSANEEDPDHFWIAVRPGELTSEATLRANVDRVRPWGIFFTVFIGELTYAVLEASHALDSEIEAAHIEYVDVESQPTK